jgi:hypothetical protein
MLSEQVPLCLEGKAMASKRKSEREAKRKAYLRAEKDAERTIVIATRSGTLKVRKNREGEVRNSTLDREPERTGGFGGILNKKGWRYHG